MTMEQRELIVQLLQLASQIEKDIYDDSSSFLINKILDFLKVQGWTNIQLFQLIMDTYHLQVTSEHTYGLFKMSFFEYLKHDPYKKLQN